MLLSFLKSFLPRRAPPVTVPERVLTAADVEQWRNYVAAAYQALPGPDYEHVLAAIHTIAKPRTYVEIGVANGQSLKLAGACVSAIGVDPEPDIRSQLPANAALFKLTSDDFFAQVDVRKQLGGLPVDLAFIDGMHLFDFALRDFIALERLCAPASTILVHDTYPLDRISAARKRETEFWSGDVWRLVLVLKKYRPDLAVHTVATAPTGLTLIRNLDPASRVLADRRDAIIDEFMAIDYEVLEADKPAALNLMPNDAQRIRELLG